jgi:arabinose-5-phosphate isomerase
MAVLEKKGFTVDDFRSLHPQGQLGFKLLRVEAVMHKDDEIPRVHAQAAMQDVITEMSKKGLGIAGVVDDAGHILGVISDGDLRRQLQNNNGMLKPTAAEGMTQNPVTVAPHEAATAALALMETRRITALLVPDENGKLIGVLHLHDLWRLGKYF